MIIAYRLKKEKFMEAVKESANYSIFFILLSILIFKAALSDTGSALDLYAFMHTYHIPEILVVMIFPMLVGIISGLTVAFVGISFPILLYILAPSGVPYIPMIALAYLSGFIGVLFSPLHLCLIYSAEYFKADLAKVFRKLIAPLTTLFIIGSLYSLFLSIV
jgi:integral membrane protein (TIGR00529 family)